MIFKSQLAAWMTAGGVATASVGGIVAYQQGVFEPQQPQISQPAPETVLVPKVEEEVASLPATEEPSEVLEATPERQLPSFGLLRVEPDGSAVIAGTAAPNSSVAIMEGNRVIIEGRAGPTGDFAFVLDEPLAPGAHELTIRETLPDSEPVFSAEAGIISVPERDGTGELLALVTEEGAPSRILQKPEPPVQVETIVEASPEPVTEPVTEVETAAVEEVPVAEPETVPQTPGIRPVLVEAVEIEGDKVFVAGSGEPGRTVRIYLDRDLLGSAVVGDEGAFLVQGNRSVGSGAYTIRADMLEPGSGDVAARAAVRLLHDVPAAEPEVAVAEAPVEAAEPEPKVEIAAVEEQTAVAETGQQATEAVNEEIPVIRTGASIIIRRGDNLWQISRRTYGEGIRFTTIFDANRDQIKDPNLIFPGQVIKVPEDVSRVGTEAENTSGNGTTG